MNSLGKFPHLHDQQGSLLGVSIPAATHVGSIFSSKKWLSLLALIGLAYRASYPIKFTQQISPLTLNCAFTMPKPQPTSPAAVEAFQRGQPRPPSLLPGFLGSCHLRFLCSQRFFDLILSRSKDRRDFLLVDTESCTNKASTFIFIIRFCVKPHVKTPCWETEMKLPKPFFLCLIQTTPFLKRSFSNFNFSESPIKGQKLNQRPTPLHRSQPRNTHPSPTQKTCLRLLEYIYISVPHLFSNPSGIYFQNAWQKATCHRNFMANTKIHSRVQTLHQWSSVQQFLTCMNFYHGCRLWLPSEKPVQSSWCWDLSTNPQMMCPLLATSTTMDSKPPATVTLGLALNSYWWAFSTTKTPLNKWNVLKDG